MGHFKLTIATGNAAFDHRPEGEIARILRALADQLDDGDVLRARSIGNVNAGELRDHNGNRVGRWRWQR